MPCGHHPVQSLSDGMPAAGDALIASCCTKEKQNWRQEIGEGRKLSHRKREVFKGEEKTERKQQGREREREREEQNKVDKKQKRENRGVESVKRN